MTTIILPTLPEPDCITDMGVEYHSTYLIRTYSLEVARLVLEGAAKVCDHWSKQNHVYVNGALRCGEDIRNLEIKHE